MGRCAQHDGKKRRLHADRPVLPVLLDEQMARHVRKNDLVEVIAGDHRGARGKVLRVDPDKKRVVVEGVNVVFRHVRPTRKNPQGGRIQKEAPIHLSNVLPVDASSGKPQRVRFETQRDEKGAVVSKRRLSASGNTLHVLAKQQT
jgi:large subunit ribosomal protein L24